MQRQNYVTSPWPAGPYFSLTPTTRPIAIELGREKSRKAARTARAAGAAVFPVTAKREKPAAVFFLSAVRLACTLLFKPPPPNGQRVARVVFFFFFAR